MTGEPRRPTAVSARRLGFTYAGRSRPTLEDVSFAIEPGTWTLLAGRTGCGKSTLLRALAGLIPHHTAGEMQGDVRLFGESTRVAAPVTLAGRVGLLLQSPDEQICATTVAGEMAFGLENLAVDPEEIEGRIADGLGQAGLDGYDSRSTHRLSGGEKGRLTRAAVLAMRPGLLLLDEPLGQLDPCGAQELLVELERLKAAGMTIVLAEHRLDELIPAVDRLLVLEEGRLVGDAASRDADAVRSALESGGLPLPELMQLATRIGYCALTDIEGLVERATMEGRGSANTPGVPATPASAAPPSGDKSSVTKRPVVASRRLAHRFADSTGPLWAEVNFELMAGERVALLGPNGCGKSTLLAMLAGLITPNAGGVEFAEACDSKIVCGLVLQNPDLSLFCRTVREELAFGPRAQALADDIVADRVARAAEEFELGDLLDDHPLALSQGQRLRTAVAATVVLEPRLLLLDEPTTGQDAGQVSRIMEALSRHLAAGGDSSLLFSTHDLRTAARFADRAIVLCGGRIAFDGPPTSLLADGSLLAAAGLRRSPLFEARHRLGLQGVTVDALARELTA